MGLKLEYLLMACIVAIVGGVYVLDLGSTSPQQQLLNKELEYTYTTMTEVDTQKLLSQSYGTYGIRNGGILTMDNLAYHTDTIEFLVAKKGKVEGDLLYLDGDVVLKEKDGHKYETQHATYDQKTEILNILSPFTAKRDKNIMSGSTLHYNTRKKEAYGTSVDSIIYTTEK